jgi:hypothetical protein
LSPQISCLPEYAGPLHRLGALRTGLQLARLLQRHQRIGVKLVMIFPVVGRSRAMRLDAGLARIRICHGWKIGRFEKFICSVPHRTSNVIPRFQAKRKLVSNVAAQMVARKNGNVGREPAEPVCPRDIRPRRRMVVAREQKIRT